ncbi:hypothetical protein [Pelagicoccus sp. SDUM812003]|uniref:hypothetical protein n=1 Tax=Pelagicoccus sp. SDUM812003 TaxID=3041267 RepID=UPI00281242A4|nr:hypothetical protein [Pelagicoccus sp. SDUM812003]
MMIALMRSRIELATTKGEAGQIAHQRSRDELQGHFLDQSLLARSLAASDLAKGLRLAHSRADDWKRLRQTNCQP